MKTAGVVGLSLAGIPAVNHANEENSHERAELQKSS